MDRNGQLPPVVAPLLDASLCFFLLLFRSELKWSNSTLFLPLKTQSCIWKMEFNGKNYCANGMFSVHKCGLFEEIKSVL